jgi:agmatine/peptidylarginine deiminase
MNSSHFRLAAALALLGAAHLGCYNRYSVPVSELDRLESGNIAEFVDVETDEGPVTVRATTPIEVQTNDGRRFNVSPFNFALTEQQLVAPDYDLLVSRNDLAGARVSQFSKGRTIGLAVGSVLAAGGAFVAISVLAGSESE